MNKPILVTSPYLPPLEEYIPYLQKIWDNHWLTNNGEMHKRLEKELADYLGVNYISLFSNGTLALITALQALEIKGDVITTPYSFVATSHSIIWNKCKPVFVDVDNEYFNIDPTKIEAAITPETTAIMPVHVYGNPCNVDEIEKIAKRHNLKVIYDAAHAFNVKKNGTSILKHGDLSILSFHATKVYSTVEGGAIVCHSEEMKHHIDNLKNFGFRGETTVEEPGINAKLNELQAAYGLLSLKYVDKAIANRKNIANIYREGLENIPGIYIPKEMENVCHNYSYFPIFIDSNKFGKTRDEVYEQMKSQEIYGRRYFYPLITDFEPYKDYPSSQNLPVARQAADSVICLPMYPTLSNEDAARVVKSIKG